MALPEAIQNQVAEAEAVQQQLYGQASDGEPVEQPAAPVDPVEPAPVEPQVAEPVAQEVKPDTVKAKEDTVDYWKSRFETVRGKLDTELPDMQRKYDVAEAKKLLAAAGLGNGFKTTIDITPQYFTNSGYQDSVERMIGDLKAGGIEATIKTTEYGVWIASVYRPPFNFDGILWGPGRYYADPDPYVAYWLHPKGIANQSRVNDPAMAALVEKQATQINPKERWETLKEIQRVEAKNSWYLWRPTPKTSIWVQNRVHDFARHEGYDSHEFWSAWVD